MIKLNTKKRKNDDNVVNINSNNIIRRKMNSNKRVKLSNSSKKPNDKSKKGIDMLSEKIWMQIIFNYTQEERTTTLEWTMVCKTWHAAISNASAFVDSLKTILQ